VIVAVLPGKEGPAPHEKGIVMGDLQTTVVVGDTRPGRGGRAGVVGVRERAPAGTDDDLANLHDYPLPPLDEAMPPPGVTTPNPQPARKAKIRWLS